LPAKESRDEHQENTIEEGSCEQQIQGNRTANSTGLSSKILNRIDIPTSTLDILHTALSFIATLHNRIIRSQSLPQKGFRSVCHQRYRQRNRNNLRKAFIPSKCDGSIPRLRESYAKGAEGIPSIILLSWCRPRQTICHLENQSVICTPPGKVRVSFTYKR
jgi:hypothetical protein